MKPLTDEEWVAQARERLAHGDTWQTSDAEMLAPSPAVVPVARAVGSPKCPYCTEHPALEVFERTGSAATEALWYCATCYGFWAPPGSIDEGVTGENVDSPALEAMQAPRRCRGCFGHLKPDGTCAKCGRALPAMDCPAGHGAMERFDKEGVTLDSCKECHGVWFDIGEISAVYHLAPAQSAVTALGAVSAGYGNGGTPPEWMRALVIVARLLLPLLRL